MKYEWAKGCMIRGNSQEVGETIAKLKVVTAGTVLQEASRADSKLHEYFEWNDTKAAHEYRMNQSGNLIRAVKVVINEGIEPIRAFVSVKVEEVDSRVYMPSDVVMRNVSLRQQALAIARSELNAIQKKYHEYEELYGVFQEIEKLPAAA